MCIHKWNKWGLPFTSAEEKPMGRFGEHTSVPVVQQERICQKCGAVSSRFVREGKYSDGFLTTASAKGSGGKRLKGGE